MKTSFRLSLIAVAATGIIVGFAAMLASRADQQVRPATGLMTSLPIYWVEADQLTLEPASSTGPHWAKAWLERRFSLVLLDTLTAQSQAQAGLAQVRQLILAQPRVLQPAELVALDDWVRAGGRVLIFADPMMTEESRYGLGDPRRPQMAALLSPILTRWGLEQRFDESQPAGLREARLGPLRVPVNQAGHFVLLPGLARQCEISDGGLVAQCALGQGRAVLFADAAILSADAGTGSDRAAMQALVSRAFD